MAISGWDISKCSKAPAEPWMHCEHLDTCRFETGTYTYVCCYCDGRRPHVVPYYREHGIFAPETRHRKTKRQTHEERMLIDGAGESAR